MLFKYMLQPTHKEALQTAKILKHNIQIVFCAQPTARWEEYTCQKKQYLLQQIISTRITIIFSVGVSMLRNSVRIEKFPHRTRYFWTS